MLKSWGTGDKLKDDNFKGPNPYVTIESYETRDNVNKTDLTRPVRNVFENTQHVSNFLEATALSKFQPSGIFKKSFGDSTKYRGFSAGDSDVASITFNNGFGDTRRHYARLSPGIALHKGITVVSRPETHILERELSKIFGLQDWNDEGVYVNYFYNTDRYQTKITRRHPISGVLYNYVYGGTWGDSVNVNNFKNCFKMLENIWADSLWKPLLMNQIGDSFIHLCIEPTVQIKSYTVANPSDTVIWRINKYGKVVGDTGILLLGDSTTQTIRWVRSYITGVNTGIANEKAGTRATGDSRQFYQNFNDYDRFVYLNVPRTFGDSTTATFLKNPWSDTWQGAMFTKVVNTDAYITVLRQTAGIGTSAYLAWMENNLPKVTGYSYNPARNQKFFTNKDLIVWRGKAQGMGDTLGSSWASVMEMSGDSWTFFGDKIFRSQDGNSTNGGLYPYLATDQSMGRSGNRWKIWADSINVLRAINAGDSIISRKTIHAIGRIISGDSVFAENTIKAGDSLQADKGLYVRTGAIRTIAGNISSSDTVYATKSLFSLHNIVSGDSVVSWKSINALLSIRSGDSVFAENTIKAGDSLQADKGLYVRTGAIRTAAGNIQSSNKITAGDSVVAGKGFSATAGAIRAEAGSIYALNKVSAGDSIVSSKGIAITAGELAVVADKSIWIYNSTYSRLNYTADASASAGVASTVGLVCAGGFAAYRVYNAIWNDYAEGFTYDKEKEPRPIAGLVYKQTSKGLTRTEKRAEKGTVGVFSDSYAQLIDSKDCLSTDKDLELQYPKKTKLPIGLAGKLSVFVKSRIKIGDALVSDKYGFATKANILEKIFKQDRIIGTALEEKNNTVAKRVLILIK